MYRTEVLFHQCRPIPTVTVQCTPCSPPTSCGLCSCSHPLWGGLFFFLLCNGMFGHVFNLSVSGYSWSHCSCFQTLCDWLFSSHNFCNCLFGPTECSLFILSDWLFVSHLLCNWLSGQWPCSKSLGKWLFGPTVHVIRLSVIGSLGLTTVSYIWDRLYTVVLAIVATTVLILSVIVSLSPLDVLILSVIGCLDQPTCSHLFYNWLFSSNHMFPVLILSVIGCLVQVTCSHPFRDWLFRTPYVFSFLMWLAP